MKAQGRDWNRIYWMATKLGSDGCTVVTETFRECCLLHDILYKTGVDPDTGTAVTRADADRIFRQCMQEKSKVGVFSPLSWIRYAGVRLFGGLFRKQVTA